jgi:hypothetical protein
MVTELSPHRYLPGPESFSDAEFTLLLNLCSRVVEGIADNEHTVDCIGFNWSPFSWGTVEERGGCQSVMTKFHMMIWQWNKLKLEEVPDLPVGHQIVYASNTYGVPFARIVWIKCCEIFERTDLFSEPEFNARGLFLPFRSGKGIKTVLNCKSFLRTVSISVSQILADLTDRLVEFDFEKMDALLREVGHRLLSEEEVGFLRATTTVRPLETVLSQCQNEFEEAVCRSVYDAVANRCTTGDDRLPIWTKRFGFSLTVCDSQQPDVIIPGLYISLHALGGAGGAAETVRCYLTRPEGRLADESVMIDHNRLLWSLAHKLETGARLVESAVL